MSEDFNIVRVGPSGFDAVSQLLFEAFFDYPVLRFMLGDDAEGDYSERLRHLMDFFTHLRFVPNHPVFAVTAGDELVAAAYLIPPETGSFIEEATEEVGHDPLEEHRKRIWEVLGPAAHRRFDTYKAAIAAYSFPEPHVHLDMLGTSHAARGQGHGRRLLDFVHAYSAKDPESRGVSLTTEDPQNVAFYQHFGYEVVGQTTFGPYESWGFFRSD